MLVDTEAVPLLFCSSILGNSQLPCKSVCEHYFSQTYIWERLTEQHCNKARRIMYNTHLWFTSSEKFPGSRFTLNNTLYRAWRALAGLCRHTDTALLSRELQRWVEYLKEPNAMHMEPGQSSTLKCLQVEWKAPTYLKSSTCQSLYFLYTYMFGCGYRCTYMQNTCIYNFLQYSNKVQDD